jgi:uncharacterized sulfatase
MCWADRVKGGRTVEDAAGFYDFAPTILEAAGVRIPDVVTGRSLLPVLDSGRSGQVDNARTFALSGRERHSHSRFDNLGYPSRALRTADYLYVRNFKPDRWPAGDPDLFADIDACPTKDYILNHRERSDVQRYFEHACGKHGEEQLYNVNDDPGCLRNLADSDEHAATRRKLRSQLDGELKRLKDPRVLGTVEIFDSYPRFSPMRPQLGGFAEQGKYNPKYK